MKDINDFYDVFSKPVKDAILTMFPLDQQLTNGDVENYEENDICAARPCAL